jgi:hypothetical protein
VHVLQRLEGAMNKFLFPRVAVYSLLILAASPFSMVFAQSDSTTPIGALWEVTSQMSMEGMPMQMPARTMKVCSAVNMAEPPGSGDDGRGCINSDYQRNEDTVTWTSTCAGPPAMTGQGEIVYTGEDAYSGGIKYNSDNGAMVLSLNGHRIGDCDKPR